MAMKSITKAQAQSRYLSQKKLASFMEKPAKVMLATGFAVFIILIALAAKKATTFEDDDE